MVLNSAMRYAVTKIINNIIDSYGIISRQSVDKYVYSPRKNIGKFYGEPYCLYNGCSKLCIIFDNLEDWVVKLPIAYDLTSKDEAELRKISEPDVKKGKFNTYLTLQRDLCAHEVNIYQDAVLAGVEDFFAEEKKEFTYHGIPIYVQRKIECEYCNSDRHGDEKDEELDDTIDEILNNICISDVIDDLYEHTQFMEDLYKFSLTKQKFINLMSFIDDNNINDLHDENFGYDFNGEPVFFDYSGYNHNSYMEIA